MSNSERLARVNLLCPSQVTQEDIWCALKNANQSNLAELIMDADDSTLDAYLSPLFKIKEEGIEISGVMTTFDELHAMTSSTEFLSGKLAQALIIASADQTESA